MKKIKIISRAVVIHNDKLLLVKNHSRDFWSFPGGHWEFENESLSECAIRETKEETGHLVEVGDMIFCQEFRKPESIVIEVYWSAKISSTDGKSIDDVFEHTDIDEDSEIEKVAWLDKHSILKERVVPNVIVGYFINNIRPNTFIGMFEFK